MNWFPMISLIVIKLLFLGKQNLKEIHKIRENLQIIVSTCFVPENYMQIFTLSCHCNQNKVVLK